MQHKKWIALLCILLSAIIAGAVFWYGKSQVFLAMARTTIADEISKGLGDIPVHIGSVEIVSFNTVAVERVVINDRKSRQLAMADKAVVIFSPLSILRGQSVVAAIEKIRVSMPQVYLIEEAAGQWNYEEVLAAEKGGPMQFAGDVEVEDGTVYLTNETGQWDLEQIAGTISFASHPATKFSLDFRHNNAHLTAKGIWNTARGTVTVTADQLAVTDYQKLVPASNSVQLIDGVLTGMEIVVDKNNGKLTFAGGADMADAGVDVDGIPVRKANGTLAFTDKTVCVFADVQVYDQPLKLRGKIAVDTTEPVLDMTVSSPSFSLQAIPVANVPVQGTIAFDARVTGIASDPHVAGQFQLSQGEYGGYALSNATAQLEYAADMLTIHSAAVEALGGSAAIAGNIGLDGSYRLQIQGNHLDAAAANVMTGLQGFGNVDLAVAGKNTTVTAMAGTVVMDNGIYNGIPFTAMQGSFGQSGSGIQLDYVNVGLEQGTVTAQGTIASGELALHVRGNTIPLHLLNALGQGITMEGSADFSGDITGTMASPQLAAQFFAYRGQAFYQPFTEAQGMLRITPAELRMDTVTVKNGVTQHTLQGTVGLQGDQALNLHLVTRQARAEDIVKLLLPGEKLTGNVDNDVMLTGSVRNISAEGHVTLTEGSFRGLLVAKGEGTYRRQNGRILLTNAAVHSLNTQVKINGEIGANEELNFDITAQDVDIGKLNKLPYPVDGRVNFTGKLQGTMEQPAFIGNVAAETLSFNHQRLAKVSGQITVDGSQLDVPNFSFEQGAGKFNFSGGMNIASQNMYGNLQVDDGQLAALLAVLNTPVKDVDGRLNGSIIMSGSMEQPGIFITGRLTKGSIKKYVLEDSEVDVSLENNIVTVNNFVAKQGQGILAVHGTADLNGPLNLEVGGRDIDAGLISALLDSSVETKGKLSFAAQIDGVASNPHAAISLEVAGGGVANATFDSLYGLLVYDNKCIQVNQLMLAKGAYRASAYGVVPVAALTAAGRSNPDKQAQMDVKVRLDEADLSILPLLTKEIAWGVGPTKGEITIGGTLAEPSLTGGISVQSGVVKLASLADPIQKVGLDIRFNGDKIDIKTFEGAMGAGTFRLTGSAGLQGLSFKTYDLQLVLDKLGVNSKYFKGPINGTLSLVQGSGRAKLSGKILLENDVIDIPYFSDLASSDLNLGLDLEVVAGKKVRLYNPYLYDIWAEGRVHFNGTTRWPDVSGRFVATRGTVSYLRTNFKVQEATAEFIQFRSFEPVVKLNAETRLDRTRVLLEINGPVSSMDLKLSAEPAMSQQEILSLLTLRSRYFDRNSGKNSGSDNGLGRDELVALLDAGLQMRFVSEVESAFRQAFGLDEFHVVRDTLSADESEKTPGNREVYNLEIGKYLSDKFMLKYTVGIGYDDNSMGFRYDLTKRVSITGSWDQDRHGMLGVETRFKF